MVALFDSLAHPSVTGIFFGRQANFAELRQNLRQEKFLGACAVGIAGTEGYSHESFITACQNFDELIPVAGWNPDTMRERELEVIKTLGFAAVKIHPRLSKLVLSEDFLSRAFKLAEDMGMVVFYCTYQHGPILSYSDYDPFYTLVKALKAAPRLRVVLMHGGGVELIKYSELARFNSNLLLDVSFTMMKYRGSSLDLDMRFLFEFLDQRLCIGTDYPEYKHLEVRQRFEELTKGIAREKIENIGYKNILRFLGKTPEHFEKISQL